MTWTVKPKRSTSSYISCKASWPRWANQKAVARAMGSPALRPRGIGRALVAELQAEAEPLCPEVAVAEGEGRPRERRGHTGRRGGRRQVDLVARPGDVADVQERVADRHGHRVRHAVADLDIDLRHDGEAAAVKAAAVAHLGQ